MPDEPRRRLIVRRLPALVVGAAVLGLGFALGSNVSGGVLAMYYVAAAVLVAGLLLPPRRR